MFGYTFRGDSLGANSLSLFLQRSIKVNRLKINVCENSLETEFYFLSSFIPNYTQTTRNGWFGWIAVEGDEGSTTTPPTCFLNFSNVLPNFSSC